MVACLVITVSDTLSYENDPAGQAIRSRLEAAAKLEGRQTGEYLRPVMLLQAQPRSQTRETLTVDVIRQTLRNWTLLAAHRLGSSPDKLASYYRRHDTAQ